MPELSAGRPAARAALLLAKAGLDGSRARTARCAIGATTPVAALVGADARAALDLRLLRRRLRDPQPGHDRRQPLRAARAPSRRAATCRRRCSRSAPASARAGRRRRAHRVDRRLPRRRRRPARARDRGRRAGARPRRRRSAGRTRTTTRSWPSPRPRRADGVRVAVAGRRPARACGSPSVEQALAGGADAAAAAARGRRRRRARTTTRSRRPGTAGRCSRASSSSER